MISYRRIIMGLRSASSLDSMPPLIGSTPSSSDVSQRPSLSSTMPDLMWPVPDPGIESSDVSPVVFPVREIEEGRRWSV